jgi:hypothetical protein
MRWLSNVVLAAACWMLGVAAQDEGMKSVPVS